MALDWNISKCKDVKQLTEDPAERVRTEGICWASMVYDLGTITAENVDEWLFRQEYVLRTEQWGPIHKSSDKEIAWSAALEDALKLAEASEPYKAGEQWAVSAVVALRNRGGVIPATRLGRDAYERRIGMWTNVATLSRARWLKRRQEHVVMETEALIRRLPELKKPDPGEC